MQKFLFHIEDEAQIHLFHLLAQQLGIEMTALQGEEEEENHQERHTEGEDLLPSPSPYYPMKATYGYEDILSIVAQFPEDKLWTFSDLQDEAIFPETTIKKQLIDNQLYLMPNPSTLHQKIIVRASRYIDAFVDENNLGDVYVAPVSVKIDENNALEPDIIFISLSKRASVGMQAITTAPELVVEVISPANYKKLREEKKARYADFGVQEYWEIYPQKRYLRIEILTQDEATQEKSYQVFSEAEGQGEVYSKVLEGFRLNVEKIFR